MSAKLPSLTLLASPASGDLLYVVDVSDTTDAATGSSRKLTLGDLTTFLGSSFDAAGAGATEAAAAVAAHVALSDPHAQYLTAAEGNAAYDAIGAASTVQGLACLRASNLSDVANVATAKTNLGAASLTGGNSLSGDQTVSGRILATSTTNEHTLTLNHAADTSLNANVVAWKHTADGGAASARMLDKSGNEQGAGGYLDPNSGSVYDVCVYLASDIVGNGPAINLRFLQGGYWRGSNRARARVTAYALTGDYRVHAPSTSTDIGPRVIGVNPEGSAIAGQGSLAAGATAGFLYLPRIANTPTAAPPWESGSIPVAVDVTNNKIVGFFADETKSIQKPDWYLALTEGAASAATDQCYYGAGWWTAANAIPGFGSTTPKNGVGYRTFNGTTQGFVLAVGSHGGVPGTNGVPPGQPKTWEPTNVGNEFHLSFWVRPQTAFAACHLYAKDQILTVQMDGTGKVLATQGTGGSTKTIPAAAATQLALNTWSFVRLWRDDSAKLLKLQVDGGAVQTVSYTGTPPTNGGGSASIGCLASGTPSSFFTGDISDVSMFQSDGLLTGTKSDTIYDGGSGRFFTWPAWSEPTGGSGSWKSTAALT